MPAATIGCCLVRRPNLQNRPSSRGQEPLSASDFFLFLIRLALMRSLSASLKTACRRLQERHRIAAERWYLNASDQSDALERAPM
ncbi:hypothetical protein G6F40_014549 [Rhizopus arrhizus]|nr:hypothetical protein G6F40_014549 [Rhizopus arrhizus]